MLKNYLIFFFLIKIIWCNESNNYITDCNLPEDLIQEIANYSSVVNAIISSVENGAFKGLTYNELAVLVDKFGHRFTGTQTLENVIDFLLSKYNSSNLDNFHTETVEVPHWVRGNESATLIEPRVVDLPILGLGSSIATPPEGILAEVLVVTSFEELEEKSNLAKGKIIVFNEPWVSYGETVRYRSLGASAAAKAGGVASLIRSVTPFSMKSPHTGWQDYEENVEKIPTACITVEDANMLQRIQSRNETIKILLKMDAQNLPPTTSRNLVAELVGTAYPEKVVLVSGHIDSWDVGQGAMDDGGGAFISLLSLVLLRKLGYEPRRTIRAVLWTAEEVGLVGAQAYREAHKNETDDFIFLLESDEGTFSPLGLVYSAGPVGTCILEEILKLLAPLNATQLDKSSGVGSDITVWGPDGIPSGSLLTEESTYFWFHHSKADTMDVQNPENLDRCLAFWASVAYVLADLSIDFPRESEEIRFKSIVDASAISIKLEK